MADKPAVRQRRYRSYLLRLWQENAGGTPDSDLPGGDPPLWRASLERPRDGKRLGFASLVDLFVFLENETRPSLPGSESGTGQE